MSTYYLMDGIPIYTSHNGQSTTSPYAYSREGQDIDMVVFHATESSSLESTLNTFRSNSRNVSANYVIDRDGKIYLCVPEEQRANHAGKYTNWDPVQPGEFVTNINSRSIGIEFQCGPGETFTPEQIKAGLLLTQSIKKRHNIKKHNIVGHFDLVQRINPTYKSDPGESFPWEIFADHGLAENRNRRGPDGRSREYTPEMRQAFASNYFNISNNTSTTDQDEQRRVARNNNQNQPLFNASLDNLFSSLMQMLIFSKLLGNGSGNIGNTAILSTLASSSLQSITTPQPSTALEGSTPLQTIENILS